MKYRLAEWIEVWKTRGYEYDIPDEAPDIFEIENKAPSYRRICFAVMKNDVQLQSLGYTREDCRIYNCIKREELIRRGKISKYIQMELPI
jgi:predicted phosphoadenosine phosphosulfate sulfurtransferase